MIPTRFAPYVFAGLLAGFMTLVVSGITTAINIGVPPDFVPRWFKAWLPTWATAFPALLVVRPFVQKLTERLVAER